MKAWLRRRLDGIKRCIGRRLDGIERRIGAKFVSRRLRNYQPTTWWVHRLVVALCLFGGPILVGVALVYFAYRERANYLAHKAAGHTMWVWIWDGVNDLPVLWLGVALGLPWAHWLVLADFAVLGACELLWRGFGLE